MAHVTVDEDAWPVFNALGDTVAVAAPLRDVGDYVVIPVGGVARPRSLPDVLGDVSKRASDDVWDEADLPLVDTKYLEPVATPTYRARKSQVLQARSMEKAAKSTTKHCVCDSKLSCFFSTACETCEVGQGRDRRFR